MCDVCVTSPAASSAPSVSTVLRRGSDRTRLFHTLRSLRSACVPRKRDEADHTVAWLESVVVAKSHDRWKSSQMHSTRLTADQLTTDVEFVDRR